MRQKKLAFFLVSFSAVITGYSIRVMNFWLIWVALIPFLIVLPTKSIKKSMFYGFLFGIAKGSVLLFWIIEGTARFSGTTTLLGIPLFIISILYYSVFPIIFTLIYSSLLLREKKNNIPIIFQALLASFIWISVEWLRMNVLMGIPWVKDTIAISQLRNIYGIQLASITGQWGISFAIILVNLLFTISIKNKMYNYSIFGFSAIIIFYTIGLIIFNLFDDVDNEKIKVAIIQENIKAETRWNNSNGNVLANRFFDLNREATSHNPDLIIWSETALPWTFRTDDDLIKGVLNITKKAQANHIFGILSESNKHNDKVYNSAYYIHPDGSVTSRYDKVNLLSFIEEPLIKKNLKVPFLSEGLYSNILKGHSHSPLNTDFGKIGILICNESLTPYETRKTAANGALFLVNMSNDAWIENTHLVDQHFFVGRLRAVETIKDIIINSNRGYGGHISGNGKIVTQNISRKPTCTISSVSMRQKTSFYYRYKDWFIYTGFLFILLFILKTIRI